MRVDQAYPVAAIQILEKHVLQERRLPATGLADCEDMLQAIALAERNLFFTGSSEGRAENRAMSIEMKFHSGANRRLADTDRRGSDEPGLPMRAVNRHRTVGGS